MSKSEILLDYAKKLLPKKWAELVKCYTIEEWAQIEGKNLQACKQANYPCDYVLICGDHPDFLFIKKGISIDELTQKIIDWRSQQNLLIHR